MKDKTWLMYKKRKESQEIPLYYAIFTHKLLFKNHQTKGGS